MITRDENLLKIRPQLNLEIENSNLIEAFQSITLRPILKLQNEVLIFLFKDYLNSHKQDFSNFTFTAQKSLIRETISKNLNLRNSLVYAVLCMFTKQEFEFFLENKKEVAKRIISMAQKRLQDQVEFLT